MTALTIDAFGERSVGRGITVVTEQAALIGESSEVRRSAVVVTRTHTPAAFLRVPGYGQLRQLSATRAVQEAARMIPGAYRVCRFLLERVRLISLSVQLIPALEDVPLASKDIIVTARWRVIEMILAVVIFDSRSGLHTRE